ncbi:hypothetical protein QTG54_004698, partial [Skeletonema marinoi]
ELARALQNTVEKRQRIIIVARQAAASIIIIGKNILHLKMKSVSLLLIMALAQSVSAFSTIKPVVTRSSLVSSPVSSSTSLNVADLDTVALVAGQENYGFAVVALGEALWSFGQAPSFSNAKVFIPAVIAAGVLGAVSGPMITSGDASSVALGLEIATG